MRSLRLVLISGLVLLSSPVALGLAIWLVVLGWPINFFAYIGAIILLAIAIFLRPRPFRVARRDRSASWAHPRLHALIEDVARAMDTSPPSVVALDGRFDGLAVRSGLLQRRTLVLGMPLLGVLPGQSWVALIAREMAHLKARRALRFSLASLALDTLERWVGALVSDESRRTRDLRMEAQGGPDYDSMLADTAARGIGRALALVPLALRRVLDALFRSDAVVSEFDADRRGAEVSGRDAFVDLVVFAEANDLVDDAIHRVAQKRSELGLYGELRRLFRENGDRFDAERSRRDPAPSKTVAPGDVPRPTASARLGALRQHMAPTSRHRLSDADADAILRELEDVARRVERELIDAYLYEWQRY